MTEHQKSLGVLTSGGDSQGMNAAVRAVVRTALNQGIPVYGICEGYQGMVDGGDRIRRMNWDDVGGIMQLGGTVIGTARCPAFREREGRLQAAHNLVERDIERLVIIGGDGSLTGANLFRQEWPGLLQELVAKDAINPQQAEAHPWLGIVGLVGSIDNDMFGTDMTIGADSALHRITEAIDAISSTAASHQRTFVIEVMGRNCGYLALMGGLAAASDWLLIPENPPEMDNWEEVMCDMLEAGRKAGRRDSIVVVAEGARDRYGNAISSTYVAQVLKDRLQADVRVTILGHVQRGGAPTAFDRYMSTMVGSAAVEEVLASTPETEPCVIGLRGNRISKSPLMQCVEQTRAVAAAIKAGDYQNAMELRGGSFTESFRTFRTLARSLPHPLKPGQRRLRLAVLNADAPSPGMNTAVRVAVRIGVDDGHIMLGVHNGVQGLIDNKIEVMNWQSVSGWASRGGSELGTNRRRPDSKTDLAAIARHLEEQRIEGLLVIGGWSGYETAYALYQHRDEYPAFNIPISCVPASIDNNLPGSELSIGTDTALNCIVEAVDKIKQSAVATNRVFIVEVMGRYCGYLALMSGLATGAERIYLPEEGVTLRDLQQDVDDLAAGFEHGKRLGMMICNEFANSTYDLHFMSSLFAEEGRGLFEVRKAILGHIQQGGNPTPFDRIQASRLASRSIRLLIEKANQSQTDAVFIGLERGEIRIQALHDLYTIVDPHYQRPTEQWWMELRHIARVLARSGPAG